MIFYKLINQIKLKYKLKIKNEINFEIKKYYL